MRFFTTGQIGAKRSLTPEGFLVCHDVPIARVGQQIYSAYEVPVEPNMVGEIFIDRTAEEVFREETVASFNGKPVTIDHPAEFVSPNNWRALSAGVTMNARAGAGIDGDVILADLLLTDREAIRLVTEDDIREVSAGYEADYEQIEPGRGVQRNIIANHVALVAMGRCGSRCAIGDTDMAKKPHWMDRIRTAFKSKDEASMEEALKEAKTGDADEDEDEEKPAKTGDAAAAFDAIMKRLDTMDARITTLATRDADEEKAKAEDEDDEDEKDDGKTRDAAMARFRETLSRAEILAPGLRVATADAKASARTIDATICQCQRKALSTAYATDAGKSAIDPFLGGAEATFDAMGAAELSTLFIGASEIVRNRNNTIRAVAKDTRTTDVNTRNAEFWGRAKAN